MTSTTPRGIPYPDNTDPVTLGADNMRDLALAVDADLGSVIYQSAGVVTDGSGYAQLANYGLTPGYAVWHAEVLGDSATPWAVALVSTPGLVRVYQGNAPVAATVTIRWIARREDLT